MGIRWTPRRAAIRRRVATDLLWPASVEIRPRELIVDERWLRVYRAVGFPRQVTPGWLLPLLEFPRPHSLAFFAEPIDAREVVAQMSRRLVRQQGSEAARRALGHLADPVVAAALEDTERLREEVARGDARMIGVGLWVSLYGESPADLEESSDLLLNLAEGMMLVFRLLTFEQQLGYRVTSAFGIWPPALREMDTAAWATTFPLASAEVFHPRGQIWGESPDRSRFLVIDRFRMPSPHSVVLGWSGSGKSYFAKLEAIRSRYRGLAVAIIDPEGEYRILAEAGAEILPLGTSGAELGFDPFRFDAADREGLDGQVEFMNRLLARLVEGWDTPQQGELLREAYRIWDRPGRPSASDWRELASGVSPPTAALMETASARWQTLTGGGGSRASDLGRFVVFDLSRVGDGLKSAVYLVLAEMLARSTEEGFRRLVIIDEAWYLLNDGETAAYLETLFRRARKWGTALSLLTQDFGDFVRNRAAEVCLRNAPLLVLLRQHAESLNQLAEALHLSASELERVGASGVGEGLALVGEDRVPFQVWATSRETELLARSWREGAAR